jgi:hypothetical protein
MCPYILGGLNKMTANHIRKLNLLTRQGWHSAALLILFLPVYLMALDLGVDPIWPVYALIAVLIHQAFVVVAWRSELLGNYITGTLGQSGFYIYTVLFFIFFVSRLIILLAATLQSPYSLPLPDFFWWTASAVVIFFFTWTIYSVIRYFGISRAAGADHFFPEYRSKPFVRKGIHRYTPNAMYTFGALGFLLPGLILRSDIGIALGLYNYLAVWIHYWATELPDMEYIYGKTP